MKVVVDFDTFTLRDGRDFKAVTGKRVADVNVQEMDDEVIAALVWISERRNNPDFTYEDALDTEYSAMEFDDPNSQGGESRPKPTSTPSNSRSSSRPTAASRRKRSGI